MLAISSIIDTLSEENKNEFLHYLQKKNRRGDTKNVLLFKLIDKGETTELDVKLYGKPSKNAYHALCKRLQDSLIDYVASKSFARDSNEEMEILKLLLAARIFFEHKSYKIAFKILLKAERNALSLNVYSILLEIYHTKIQYAHLNSSINLSEVIEASKQNMKHFEQEQQLNMVYALIKQRLKGADKGSVNKIVTESFSDFDIEISQALTYKSFFQLMNITAAAATLRSDYFAISNFMMEVYGIVSEKQLRDINDKHLFYHIEILNLMAVTHFRNKNFKDSSVFIEKLEREMNKKNKMYYNRFVEKLAAIKALQLTYTGKAVAALEILQEFKKESLDVDLLRTMTLFQLARFDEAYRSIVHLAHSDHWYEKKMGLLWVLKKSIIEILLLIELNKLDLVLIRLQSFNNRFSKRLKAQKESRVIAFVKLVTLYYERPENVTTPGFKKKVDASFEWIGKEKEDIFVMSFYAWLKAKMEGTELYSTTLDLVK